MCTDRIEYLENVLKAVNEYLGEAEVNTSSCGETPRDFCIHCFNQIGFFSDDAHRVDCSWWIIKQKVLEALTKPK